MLLIQHRKSNISHINPRTKISEIRFLIFIRFFITTNRHQQLIRSTTISSKPWPCFWTLVSKPLQFVSKSKSTIESQNDTKSAFVVEFHTHQTFEIGYYCKQSKSIEIKSSILLLLSKSHSLILIIHSWTFVPSTINWESKIQNRIQPLDIKFLSLTHHSYQTISEPSTTRFLMLIWFWLFGWPRWTPNLSIFNLFLDQIPVINRNCNILQLFFIMFLIVHHKNHWILN